MAPRRNASANSRSAHPPLLLPKSGANPRLVLTSPFLKFKFSFISSGRDRKFVLTFSKRSDPALVTLRCRQTHLNLYPHYIQLSLLGTFPKRSRWEFPDCYKKTVVLDDSNLIFLEFRIPEAGNETFYMILQRDTINPPYWAFIKQQLSANWLFQIQLIQTNKGKGMCRSFQQTFVGRNA